MPQEKREQTPPPRIFISYRRADSAAHAGRLADALKRRFGPDRVFTDVADITAGQVFESVIRENISQSTVMVAVIGPGWRGPRWLRRARIRSPHDWIRRELELAYETALPIIPSLVGGATLPAAEKVPPSLKFLPSLHACALRDERWDADVAEVVKAVEHAHAQKPVRKPVPAATPPSRKASEQPSLKMTHLAMWLGLAVGIAIMFASIWYISSKHTNDVTSTTTTPTTTTTATDTVAPVDVSPVLVTQTPAGSGTIDIGFMNIQLFKNSVSDERVQDVGAALAALDLDAVGLTEVENGALDRLAVDLVGRGHPVAYLYEDAQGSQDIALLYRRDRMQCSRDVVALDAHRARLTAQDPVSKTPIFLRLPLLATCSSARLRDPINVIVVHFKAAGGEAILRRRQLSSVALGEVIAASQRRSIVGGDFNADPSEALQSFTGLADVGGLRPLFMESATAGTYIGYEGRQLLIDHIWASPALKIAPTSGAASAIVALDRTIPRYTERISDHRPIITRLVPER